MSDTESIPYADLEDADRQRARYERRLQQDPELDLMVDECNRHELTRSITVSLPGGILTGQLIGVKEYHELKAQNLKKAASSDTTAEAIESAFERAVETGKERKEAAIERHEKAVENEDVEWKPPIYFHVKEAQFLSGPTAIPTDGGFLWRGRIADVSGFTEASFVLEDA